MADEVLLERRGGVLVMTLNRPAKRNAMDGAMAHALAAAVDTLDDDPTLTVGVLTGAGGAFCTGMDLAAFLTGDIPDVPGRGLGGITRTPPRAPLVAAVEGYAIAGGLELVLACDLVVAAEDARFGLPETTRGLIAGAGGLLRLPARVPRAIAAEYALTGVQFGAPDAARWGLVNRVVAPGGALAAALGLAERIAANGPLAVAATTRVIREGGDWSAAERWERMESELVAVRQSDDAQEGARAFAEKRPPRWTGR